MSETRCLALQGKQRGPSLDRQGLAPTLKSWNLYSHSPQCLLHQKGMDDLLSDPRHSGLDSMLLDLIMY